MLDAVLDPFDRAAGDARGERHENDIGKHRKLYAETAAGIRRNAQAQFRPGNAQRARHHRMHGERPLEIRQHVVAALRRIVLRDHDVAFDRRKREARKLDRRGDAAIGARERGLGIAVGKIAHRDFVGLGLRMQQRRRTFAGGERIDHRFERLIVDRDQFGGVLGDIAAFRHHQRHRFADIAHALDRQAPIAGSAIFTTDRNGSESFRTSSPVMTAQTPVMRQRARHIDADDFGMRVRRADDVGVQCPDRDRKIVGIAAAARQQRRVLLAQDGLAELSRHDFVHASPSSSLHPRPDVVSTRDHRRHWHALARC